MGEQAFENKNKGRIPHNKISQVKRDQIAALYAKSYQDVNYSYFRECLKEFEGVDIAYNTLSSILREYGLRSPEAHKNQEKEKRPPSSSPA